MTARACVFTIVLCRIIVAYIKNTDIVISSLLTSVSREAMSAHEMNLHRYRKKSALLTILLSVPPLIGFAHVLTLLVALIYDTGKLFENFEHPSRANAEIFVERQHILCTFQRFSKHTYMPNYFILFCTRYICMISFLKVLERRF